MSSPAPAINTHCYIIILYGKYSVQIHQVWLFLYLIFYQSGIQGCHHLTKIHFQKDTSSLSIISLISKNIFKTNLEHQKGIHCLGQASTRFLKEGRSLWQGLGQYLTPNSLGNISQLSQVVEQALHKIAGIRGRGCKTVPRSYGIERNLYFRGFSKSLYLPDTLLMMLLTSSVIPSRSASLAKVSSTNPSTSALSIRLNLFI